MRYFTYIAEQSFRKGAQDEILFFLNGPWSRPLILPDEEQRQRTYLKQVWYLRISLPVLIVTMLLLGRVESVKVFDDWKLFIALLVGLISLNWISQRLVFFKELKTCERLAHRMPLSDFIRGMAEKHSESGLFLGFVGSMAFVIIGLVAIVHDAQNPVIGVIVVLFFGACAFIWGRAHRYRKTHTITSTRFSNALPEVKADADDE